MSQTKPHPSVLRPLRQVRWRVSLTGEAGQASAYLYSEARLYKGARMAPLSQSTTGNISVGEKKVGHCNTRGTVWALFFPAQINCCTIIYIFNIL